MTVEDILKYLQKTRYFISGITVSGGECTLQSDFLIELFREVKKMGLTTFIDTNGSTPIYNNKELLEVMDKTMIDLKAYDSEENKMLTGLENQTVIKNIKILGKLDKVYEIRTVVVPQVLDSKKTVDEGSKLLASINPNIIYKLIKYRPLGVRENLIKSTVPTQEYMEELKEIAISNGCKNVIIV
ncbi:putative glycyl-radical enzyme activating enzyme YjjW [bioreactor metagenome]|uniref:Putative glycyl-radical enzyme activating enzyme YjjW n=1 Tax=bioreactor metagenome TaxID=1076179 RepID=A0A645BRF0_9ZZZZ